MILFMNWLLVRWDLKQDFYTFAKILKSLKERVVNNFLGLKKSFSSNKYVIFF